MGGDDFSQRVSRTKGREATEGVIPGRFALSVGKPDLPAPSGWRWTALSDVAQLESGHTPSRKHPEYWNEGIPWIGIRDAVDNHGRQIHNTYQHISQLGLENSSARLLPPRTVCLSRTASVGYVVVMGATMATSQDFVNWVCGPGLEPEYLKYVLLAENDSLLRFASGTTHQTIYYPEAKAFHALLPPVEVQQAVVRVLGALDDKIELNRKMNATLDAMARALFKSWFVDFDPVCAKAEGREPSGMDAETARLFPDEFVESELGRIPKGWEAGRIGDVIEIHDSRRVPLSSREREQRHGEFPYYGATSVMDYVDAFLFDGRFVLVGEDGSVVTSEGLPFTQYVWGRFWVNNHAHVLTGIRGFSQEHLYLLFQQTNISAYVTGAVQAKLSQGNMRKIPLVVAPDAVNAKFGSVLAPLFARFRALTEESRTLARLRDELLPGLLSGTLDVGPLVDRQGPL